MLGAARHSSVSAIRPQVHRLTFQRTIMIIRLFLKYIKNGYRYLIHVVPSSADVEITDERLSFPASRDTTASESCNPACMTWFGK